MQECSLLRRDRKCFRVRRNLETKREFSISIIEFSLRTSFFRSIPQQCCVIGCERKRSTFAHARVQSQYKVRNGNDDIDIALLLYQIRFIFDHVVDLTGIGRT